MAVRTAVATGNWSSPSTWNGGATIPQPGDTANSNGFDVTIDADVNLGASGSLLNTHATLGGFLVTAARNIIANIGSTGTQPRPVLTCSHTTGVVAVTGAVQGGSGTNAHGIANTSTGGVTVTGAVTAGSGTTSHGINNASTGALIVNGAVTGGIASGSYAINNASTGSITITGNVAGGSAGIGIALAVLGATLAMTGNVTGGSAGSVYGIFNAAASTVTVTGNVTGGTANAAHGIQNAGTGTVTVSGFAKGGDGAGGSGVNNAAQGVVTVGRAIGNNYGPGGGSTPVPGVSSVVGTPVAARVYLYAIEFGPYGMVPVTGQARMIPDALNSATMTDNALGQITLGTSISANQPVATDVRNGVSYYGGLRTGSLLVPAASSVDAGVGVDATVGTAALSAAAVTAAVPTAAAIATAVWAAGTRSLTTFGTLVADVATAVWAAATRSLTSGSAPTAAAIRAEIDANSTKLDVAVSTRNSVAPDNTSITAIKAKTDNLPSDPADASDIAGAFAVVNGNLTTIAGYIDTEVGAIKAKTDALPAAPAAVSDIPTAAANASAVWANSVRSLTTFGSLVADIWAAVTRTLTGSSAPTTAQIRTELATELARIDVAVSSRNSVAPDNAGVAAIKARTDLIPNAPAAVGDLANLDVAVSTRATPADVAAIDAPTVSEIRSELAPELARIDTTISSRNAVAPDNAAILAAIAAIPTADLGTVWDAVRADHATPDSFGAVDEWASAGGGGGGGSGATPQEIWSYASRTLTLTAAQMLAALTGGSNLLIISAVTFGATLTGLTFPAGWDHIYLTLKSILGTDDTEAILQIVVSNPGDAGDGITYINGQPAAGVAGQGSLVVDGDSLAITIGDNATTLLLQGTHFYDVKCLLSDSTSVLLAAGRVSISNTPTQTVE